MVEDFAHDSGIGKERENNHRDGLRGGRALGTRERVLFPSALEPWQQRDVARPRWSIPRPEERFNKCGKLWIEIVVFLL
jgi:hypothetical protein